MAESQNRTLTEQFMLRLPDGMRERIKFASEANNRSMNAEIVATLEKEYPAYMEDPDDFAGYYAEVVWHYSKARGKAEKQRVFDNLRNAVERHYPGKTLKRGFLGVPEIIDVPSDDD